MHFRCPLLVRARVANSTPTWSRAMRSLVLGGALVMFAAMFPSGSVRATDGRTAVGMCIDSTASGARCEWSVNDKGEIDICNKNGCVYCPSATDQCSVVSRTRPRPSHALPGAIVSTRIGWFEVGKHPGIEKLIPASPKKKP